MNETLEFLARHGAALLFVAVFVEQLGVPLPASPWLLAAGALAGAGRMHWLGSLVAAALGSVVADLTWFYLGRRGGHGVLSLLCRIALEPDSCARKTQTLFSRFGMRGVIVSKFIPGLSVLMSPLAGSSGVSVVRFLCFDVLGSLLYAGFFITVGVVFSRQLEQIFAALAGLGHSALSLLVGLLALYIGFKYFQRHRLLRELRMARITVDELHQKQEAGENPIIFDLRAAAEIEQDPLLIRGAVHVSRDEMERRRPEIPRDREIILYCSCPNEVSSAKMALWLHRQGLTRVRPLLGGIEAWRERNYPTERGPVPAHGDTVAPGSPTAPPGPNGNH